MPEHGVLPDVIERFLDSAVPPPALADIRAKGASVRRRRRGAVASGVAVVVIAGGGFTGQLVLGNDRREPPANPNVEQPVVPTPPPGTRWAGIGQVVMAVPNGWADGAVRCNQPSRDTVYFADPSGALCRPAFRHVSSLAISDHAFEKKAIALGAPDGDVAGHEVRLADGCFKATDGPCFANISVPELGAFFKVTIYGRDAEEQVQQMRNSLTVLSDGITAVPYLGPEPFPPGDVDRLVTDLVAAGFNPVVETLRCPPTAACTVGAWVEPQAGRVPSAGETVTINVMPGFGKLDRGGLECPDGGSTRFFHMAAPASAEEARAQDWPTTARSAALQTIPQLSGLPGPTLDPAVHLGRGVKQFTVRDFGRAATSVVTVRELIPNAWAVTEISTCTDR